MQFPLFPSGTGLINPTLGVRTDADDMVWYLHNGAPIFFHATGDQGKFRYVTSHLVFVGLCTQAQVMRFFHVSESSVQRYLKIYREKGEAGFIGGSGRKGGVSYKSTPEFLREVQSRIDKGQSQSSIARDLGISEGTIRYQMGLGALKKRT